MSQRGARCLARSLLAVALLLFAGTSAMWIADGTLTLGAVAILKYLLQVIGLLSLPAIGALVAARQPGNPVGWLLLAVGLIGSFVAFGYPYYLYPTGMEVGHVLPLQAPVRRLTLGLNEFPWLFYPFVLLLFPNGRLPSPSWRPVAWLAGLTALVPLAITAVSFDANYGPDETTVLSAAKYHGYGGEGWLGDLVYWSWQLSRVLVIVAAISIFVRMRRARARERQQLKWAAYGSALFAVHAYLAPFLVEKLLRGEALHSFLFEFYYPYPSPLLQALVPACFAVGILRYRLFDIDVVISKTLVYAGLAALVTGVYVGVVVGVGSALGSASEPNIALSIAATALVAIAFQPARERLERLVNRLVYGRRSAPYDVLADFARRMSGALSIDEVLPGMAEAVARGLGAERSRIRVQLPQGDERVVEWPGESGSAPFDRAVEVVHREQPVGEIAVAKPAGERLSRTEVNLLADLSVQAGPALRNVGLLVELEDRLEEISIQAADLKASRTRIVMAQDAERRRIERNLHDGAQQHLVSLAGQLRLLGRMLPEDAAGANRLVARLRNEADQALEGIRDLARGIFPQLLADKGLAAALSARIAKHGSHARLECEPAIAEVRFDARTEAAVYFCCLEAMQNSAKHAAGAPLVVRLSHTSELLEFEVADSGPGFDADAILPGAGLTNMSDRIAAVGGDLAVRSKLGLGTTVCGSLPTRDGDREARAATTRIAQSSALAASS